jgi:alkylhydroperoxidase family enzyme
MAFIRFVPEAELPSGDRVPDQDNILRIHGVHSKVMRHHYDLYLEVMRRRSPLSRIQREMVAVVVSGANQCHY